MQMRRGRVLQVSREMRWLCRHPRTRLPSTTPHSAPCAESFDQPQPIHQWTIIVTQLTSAPPYCEPNLLPGQSHRISLGIESKASQPASRTRNPRRSLSDREPTQPLFRAPPILPAPPLTTTAIMASRKKVLLKVSIHALDEAGSKAAETQVSDRRARCACRSSREPHEGCDWFDSGRQARRRSCSGRDRFTTATGNLYCQKEAAWHSTQGADSREESQASGRHKRSTILRSASGPLAGTTDDTGQPTDISPTEPFFHLDRRLLPLGHRESPPLSTRCHLSSPN